MLTKVAGSRSTVTVHEVMLNKAHVTIARAFTASEQYPHSHFVQQPLLLPASKTCAAKQYAATSLESD